MSIIKSYVLKQVVRKVLYSPVGNKVFTAVGGRIYADRLVKSHKKHMLEDARKQFEKGSQFGTFEDYQKALGKHWVSYNEYAYQYEFWRMPEERREEYISRLKMQYFYWRYVPGIYKVVLRDKNKFLVAYKKYIYRKWLYVPESSYDEFYNLVSVYDCMAKPTDGTCGQGIFKIYKSDDPTSIKSLYEKCVKFRMLIEECIEACDELKAFHPQSLNSIRLVTFSNKEKSMVFSSRFKMGVGDSVIDNVHAGGLFAQVNVETGIVETDGISVNGDFCEYHPDTGIKIKGFQIPKWNDIVNTCFEAARMSDNPIIGWDVVVNNKGQVEFIEGNHGPDIDTSQSPQKGLKKRIYALIKEYYGVELK